MHSTLPISKSLLAGLFSIVRGIILSNQNIRINIKKLLVTAVILFGVNNIFGQVANYYTFSQSSGTYTAITGGTLHGTAIDDAAYSFTLPFSFTYDGSDYTVAKPSTNGFLVLGGNTPAANQYTPLSSGTTNFAISAMSRDLISSVRSEVIGTAPNRVYVCQWSSAYRYAVGSGENLNAQVRLYEGSNKIEIVYGSFTTNNTTLATGPLQVGLRGGSTSEFNNRTTTTNWATTAAGGTNTATCAGTTTVKPASGRTFSWSPPLYRAQFQSADTGSTTWCPGESRNVSVTIKNIGSAPWTDIAGSEDFNIGIKWNTNGSNWSDYNVRVDAKNLAPGATETYTFEIAASNSINTLPSPGYTTPLAAGPNNLTFDIVREAQFWFGNNRNGGGPGNTVFTTPSQTISSVASALVPNNTSSTNTYLTWSGPGNYIVEYGAPGFTPGTGLSAGVGGNIASVNATSPYFLTGLTASTNYDVYVRKINCPSVGMFGANSPKANFKTLALCVAPSAQPTALVLTPVAGPQINGSFTAATGSPTGYLVIRSLSNTLSGNPVDGVNYTAGSALGGGIVVSSGAAVTFTDTGLTPNITYYYYVISYNTTICAGGPKYRTTTPLTGNKLIPCGPPAPITVSAITSTTAQLSWSAAGNYIIEYGSATFTPGLGATAGAGGTIATATASSPYILQGLNPGATYKVVVRYLCSPGGYSSNSVAVNFTTLCKPTVETPTTVFITDVRFLGTVNDVINNDNGNGANGYQNFTSTVGKTRQAAGEGINVFVQSNGTNTSWKGWVDWSKNGDFDNTVGNSEIVFTSSGTQAISTTFGFIIPPGTAPGDYVMRIRNLRTCIGTGFCGNVTFGSCDNFTGNNFGEIEDYIITVLPNCGGIVESVIPAVNCGPGSITLSATGNTGTKEIRWYDAETGGNLLSSSPVDPSFTASYTTPSISSTTTYYVTAFDGNCESIFRRPIVARIRPVPNISFDLPLANANFCGEENTLKLTSIGSQEQIILLEENFDSGLGMFRRAEGSKNDGVVADTGWQNQASTFKPVGNIWSPAISSGFGGNKFAYATSDYSNNTVETILISKSAYDTNGFTNLKLTFSAYYSYYGDTSPQAGGTVEGFFVEVSANGGAWTTVQPYYSSLGFGTRFQNMTVPLDAYIGVSNLKIRFRYLAYWADGVAIDNVKLFGDKPLSTSFVWTAPNIGIYQSNCSTPYVDGTPTSSVCIKPTDAQLQTIASWNISALATLSNGCTTTGVIAVKNNNKVWDTTASTTWGATDKWLPTNEVPDIGKCVIIKKAVNLLNSDGFAKNIKIQPGGSLTIKKDRTLTVTDYIKNETTPLPTNEANLIVETDGNFIQLNNGAANSGRMTAQRLVNGLRYNPGSAVDYVYWSSPVGGQKTKNTTGNTDGFSSGTANTNFFTYRESNDRFYETGDPTFTLGKGYAVQAERNKGSLPFDRLFEFKGTPNNGDIGFPLAFTNASHGYNLVGNPYPSNINFEQLHYGNSSLIWGTAWFWTNNVYTANQMGSGYTGNNYAIWNGSGGVPASSPYNGGKVPKGIVKVGQAFIVQAKSAGTLNFKNKYDDTHILRVNTTGDFYSKSSTPKNRFLIQLLSPSQLSNSQLIAYVEGATDGFEQDYDAEAFDNYSDLFYSVILGKKLVIQGKSEAFTNEDKVILGANFFQNGSYTIALENAEGIFNGSQNIYLKDKQEGIITNLSQGSYTFLATKADNATRFEIIYKPETVLLTDSNVKEGVVVYRDSDDFVVKAQHKKITSIEVFDVAGRLIYSLTPNSIQTFLPGAKLLNSIYVLKINQGGIITTKKIIK